MTDNSTIITKPIPEDESKQEQEDSSSELTKDFPSNSYLKDIKEINYRDYKVGNVENIYYIPKFISEEDEKHILKMIYDASKRWVTSKHTRRRLQKWGGDARPEGIFDIEPLPDWLESLSQKFMDLNITPKRTNYGLINEYPFGVGIVPHTDGPMYHPFVCILTLQSATGFKFYEDHPQYEKDNCSSHLYVEPGSLLVFHQEAYSKHLHCIREQETDTVSFALDRTDAGSKPKVLKSNIDNAIYTSLYEQAVASGVTEITKEITRETRVSITLRNIPLKEGVKRKDK